VTLRLGAEPLAAQAPPGLAVSLRVVDKIARTPRGKYLELISELD